MAQLPPSSVVQELIDVYFAEANWYFGLLERHYFDKAHASWQQARQVLREQASLETFSDRLLHFPALLYQVIAAALQFLPPDSAIAKSLDIQTLGACDRLSERWSKKGAELMTTLELRQPTIPAVQHELMRSFWLKNSGSGKQAWHFLGSAVR